MPGSSDRDRKVVELLVRRIPGLVAAYRYGSSGTPSERPDSDVDLAFLAAPRFPAAARFEAAQDLAMALGRDVDLVALADASTVLQAQIVSSGVRIFCADEFAAESFEDRVYSAYALLNEERRGILEDIARRGTIYGR